MAFTLKYGDETTAPINMVDPTSLPVLLNPGLMNIPVNDWLNQANNYILTGFKAPSAADIQVALERLPSIGAGGVKVTSTPATPPSADKDKPVEPTANYSIEFVGKNAEKEVGSISLGNYYSVFPQEYLTMIIDAAKGLLGGGGGGGSTTTTTFPGGVTLAERIHGDARFESLILLVLTSAGGPPADLRQPGRGPAPVRRQRRLHFRARCISGGARPRRPGHQLVPRLRRRTSGRLRQGRDRRPDRAQRHAGRP